MPAAIAVDPNRTRLMRAAGDLIGVDKLATRLNIKVRSLHYFMAGDRQPNDGLIADTRRALIEHRQLVAALVQAFRDHEGIRDADR